MDFSDQVKQFSKRIEALKTSIRTEEATKTSIIMPFFSMLGYDVFNPSEFTPEFIADVGIKKGEKVDYAIIIENEPAILIEAKAIDKSLERHDSQLFRYFGTTRAKFAILTNGIIYRFYTDIEERNKMDKDPFLEINMLKLKDSQINELKRFTKSSFNIEEILDVASLLKYENKFKTALAEQIQNPTDEFTKLFLSGIHNGPKTQAVIEKFKPILKKALNDYLNETLNEKILAALGNTESKTTEVAEDVETDSKQSVTDDEMEAFFIVKTILKNQIDMRDLYYKKTESYFAVLYKNSVRKWICRFIITDNQKTLILPDKTKKQNNKFSFESITDIMDYKNQIISVINYYLDTNTQTNDSISASQPIQSTPVTQSQSEPFIPVVQSESIQSVAADFVPVSQAVPQEPYKVRIYPRPKRTPRKQPNKHLCK